MPGVSGSRNTGIDMTAQLVLAQADMAVVPEGVVFGQPAAVAYYLAVCEECGRMVMPFGEWSARE